jgi:hypothetical protein
MDLHQFVQETLSFWAGKNGCLTPIRIDEKIAK